VTPLGPTVAGVLTEALGDPDDRKIEGIYAKEGKALFGGVRVMNKTERFRLVRRALKVACSIALHEKVSPTKSTGIAATRSPAS